jgi:hypothetical protein
MKILPDGNQSVLETYKLLKPERYFMRSFQYRSALNLFTLISLYLNFFLAQDQSINDGRF